MEDLTCQRSDKDCAKLICGHPLPCPHHVLRVAVIIEDKETEKEKLCRLFKALTKAKDILGEETWMEIRRLLVEGSIRTKEAAMLQGLRRNSAAAELGMSREKYEEFVKSPCRK